MRKLFALAGIAAICIVSLAANAQDVDAGKSAFQAHCASCHGENANGKFLRGPNIKGKTVDDIQKKKHALKKLDADELKNVGAYLATLK